MARPTPELPSVGVLNVTARPSAGLGPFNLTAKTCANLTHMRLYHEEPFGPVVPFVRGIATPEEAIAIANRSKYGLQGCIFTQNLDSAIRLADMFETGTVQVNGPPARGPDHFPFQGVRDSGIGSQGITNSVLMMTKVKTTVVNLSKPSYAVS